MGGSGWQAIMFILARPIDVPQPTMLMTPKRFRHMTPRNLHFRSAGIKNATDITPDQRVVNGNHLQVTVTIPEHVNEPGKVSDHCKIGDYCGEHAADIY